MDTASRDPEGALNPLEGPLANLRPVSQGLNRDRMLFEAGRASTPKGRGRLVWPAVAVMLAIGLANQQVEIRRERGERQRLEVALEALRSEPLIAAPAVPVMVASREVASNSVGAFSQRLRLGGWDELESVVDSPSRQESSDREGPILRVSDSRHALSF